MHKTLLKRAGITENIPFHGLRHTFATLAIQQGVDAKTVTSILDHYSAAPTPTSPGRCKRTPPRGWAASWPNRQSKKLRKRKRKYWVQRRYFLKISGLGLVWVGTEGCKIQAKQI